jgi:hypothetical protein
MENAHKLNTFMQTENQTYSQIPATFLLETFGIEVKPNF